MWKTLMIPKQRNANKKDKNIRRGVIKDLFITPQEVLQSKSSAQQIG